MLPFRHTFWPGFKSWSWGRSLKTTLLLYILIPLVLAVGITGHLALRALEKTIEKNMQRDLELIAKSIQLPLSYAMEKDETRAIYRALDSAFSIGKIYSASLYDEHGKEVALAGALEADQESQKLVELMDEGEDHGGYEDMGGSEVYSYFIPLQDTGGKISGMLQLTREKSDFKNYLQGVRMQGQLILGVSVLIMAGLVLWGQQQALGRHFSRLTRSMARVAEGDRKHRFESRGPAEIAAIGRQFNRMLDRMEQAQEEIKQRQHKQEVLQERLRRSEKLAAIGRLSAGIAHELGTPLSIVTARAQRTLRKPDLPGHAADTLQGIRREVSRMEYIIRQLLDFSRESRPQKRNIPLGMPARSAVSALSEEAAARGVEIQAVSQGAEKSIRVDPVRIEQALVNLLRNAVQASEDGLVRISWGFEGQRVKYQVDDSGPGIAAHMQSRIFEPFFTTKNVGAGTGLGLSVAHGIVEEHQGRIEVETSDLGGARLTVVLEVDN